MLGENIRILRKEKGYSQESLAERLNVVRQTVSKWEKGISVPDAVMLGRMAELFDVPVSTLLGSDISEKDERPQNDEIAKQLAVLNEYIANKAIRRRKILRGVLIAIVAVVVIMGIFYILNISAQDDSQVLTTVSLECSLDGEKYLYDITYDQNCQIIYSGGDSFVADHLEAEKYDDANVLIAQIEDYFKDRGGTCLIKEGEL